MYNDKNIEIRNIYYMLSYAFQVLKPEECENVAGQDFDGIYDLFAEILRRGVSTQLKQGLHRAYIVKEDLLSTVRGKINLPKTIQTRLRNQQKLDCEFDELSENNVFNQILKSTITKLIRCADVDIERRSGLKKLLIFFENVDCIELSIVKWSSLRFDRNSRNYQMLLYICYFIYEGLLQTDESGTYKMRTFSDEQMHKLYEKFILEYYHKNYPQLNARAKQIDWQLDNDYSDMLPIMQTDVYLQKDNEILIIDAKYYTKNTQSRFENNQSLISSNLYQIFTYVKNQEYEYLKSNNKHKVAGMLLYAKTNANINPDNTYQMSGNEISAKTLDLSVDIQGIEGQLNKIVEDYFNL